ncbi:hypothetical protein CRUP_033452 [Coryphaenoides rupestris]|nr:hypothetical protein CRUP_033452 [Coryphaenoides rupestris]
MNKGVKNADENELQSIASEPDEGHVYNVADFSIMSSIVEGLTKIVCEQVEHQDKEIKTKQTEEEPEMGAPSDFLASEVTAKSFRVSWSAAPGNVEKYRVVYYTEEGDQPDEIGILITDGKSQDDVVPPAESLRDAGVELFAVADEGHVYNVADFSIMSSIVEGLTKDRVRAGGAPGQGDQDQAFRVSWSAAPGNVEKYRVVYYTEEGEPDELDDLMPDTEYTVTVYAMFGEEASDPFTHQETTLPLSPPTNLQFSGITHNAAHINWEPPQGVKGHRITCVKTDGPVDVGPVSSYDLSGLTSLMEYSVAVYAVYDEGQSEALTDGFTTTPVPGPLNLRAGDVSADSLRVSWDHSADDVVLYKLSWAPFIGGGAEDVMLNGADDSYVLTALSPSTEYEAMLTAVFRDESESDSVSVTATTPPSRQAARNLRLGQQTTHSLEASWELEDPLVEGYRVSYAGSDDTAAAPVLLFLPPGMRRVVLQPLVPDTCTTVSNPQRSSN